MKNFFKKFINLLLRHKLLTLLCLVTFVVAVVLFFVLFGMFTSSGGKYGNRLNGIEKVAVSSKEKKDIVTFLEDKDTVKDASVRVQGKIIYINITFKKDVTLDKAKAVATETLALVDDDKKDYYDIGYFLTQEEVSEDNKGFVITGSKSYRLDNISWIKS